MIENADVAIIGGGIVGLATAHALRARAPGWRLIVLEKETQPAQHQSGHNSGVVHSGIYYAPGSLKARLCRSGGEQLLRWCDAAGVPYRHCGKVIVAVDARELPALDALAARGLANGVPGLRRITSAELRELEPAVQGCAALHLPHVAIVDFRAVALTLARQLATDGVTVQCGARVLRCHWQAGRWQVDTTQGPVTARWLVTCGGLHADQLGRLAGDRPSVRIAPFRGEYYQLPTARRSLVRGLVYPVPDPHLPFLGVHVTPLLSGEVHLGPNAVPALAREGYRRGDVAWDDVCAWMVSRAHWRMAARYWRTGMTELWRSVSRRAFLREAQRLVPSLTLDDLQPSSAGVRAQAVALDGRLVDDFVMQDAPGAVHVYNAPSPAATASLAIGAVIAERLTSRGALTVGTVTA